MGYLTFSLSERPVDMIDSGFCGVTAVMMVGRNSLYQTKTFVPIMHALMILLGQSSPVSE